MSRGRKTVGSLETKLTKMFLKKKLEKWLKSNDEGSERAIKAVVYGGPFRLYYDPAKDATIEVKGSWLGLSKGKEVDPGSEPFQRKEEA